MLITADNVSTFRFMVKHVGEQNGLHATFMPKPVYGQNGSGLHLLQSLLSVDGHNAFLDADAPWQLSRTCLSYIAGLLRHAKGFCSITNPLVNSYKRLVPGFEAPTNIAWSEHNRSPLVRVPARRDAATGVELRVPDPSCNPYLALAVTLCAGLEGIKHDLDPGPPINKNIHKMSFRERRHLRIDELPGNLNEALDALEKDEVVQDALGPHIYEHFLEAKRNGWRVHRARQRLGDHALSGRLLRRVVYSHRWLIRLRRRLPACIQIPDILGGVRYLRRARTGARVARLHRARPRVSGVPR